MKIPIQIRLAEKTDLAFILDSWTKQMKYMYPNRYALDFSKHYQEDHLKPLIDKSVSLVANFKDEPNDIISYLVYCSFRNNLVIHYGYTKVDAREQGHLHKLIEFANVLKAPIIFTHPAKNEAMMMTLMKKYIYDPSVMRLIK